jgi:hypothetical protein
MMPLAIAFQGFAWWCLHAHPAVFRDGRWHLALIGLTVLFSLNYLYGGVRLLRRRQAWIVERQVQERTEG